MTSFSRQKPLKSKIQKHTIVGKTKFYYRAKSQLKPLKIEKLVWKRSLFDDCWPGVLHIRLEDNFERFKRSVHVLSRHVFLSLRWWWFPGLKFLINLLSTSYWSVSYWSVPEQLTSSYYLYSVYSPSTSSVLDSLSTIKHSNFPIKLAHHEVFVSHSAQPCNSRFTREAIVY